MRVKLRDQFAKWTHTGAEEAWRKMSGGRRRRERREETRNRKDRDDGVRKEEGDNTWPHPDFMHATTRAEEETERVELLPCLTTRARETLRLCGQETDS